MPNIEVIVQPRPTYIDIVPPPAMALEYVKGLAKWGQVVGDIADQADLVAALAAKLEAADLLFSAILGNASDNASLVAYMLSHKYIPLHFHWAQSNPADGVVYYIGAAGWALSTSTAIPHIKSPADLTVFAATITSRNNISGTPEPVTFRAMVNGADHTITTNYVFNNAPPCALLVEGLNISLPKDADVYIKMVTPNWATNPTNTSGSVTLWCR